MYCRNCGSKINDKAEYCTNCGCKPLNGNQFCQECGTQTNPKQEICVKCGVRLQTLINKNNNSTINRIIDGDGTLNLDFSNLDPYYQAEFTKIYKSNEAYKGKWNWFAFLFGALWALTKGVWVSPLLAIILSFFTYGFVGFIYACICGIRGNYMYYNVYVKNKQLLI